VGACPCGPLLPKFRKWSIFEVFAKKTTFSQNGFFAIFDDFAISKKKKNNCSYVGSC
jgi:hypothetical protein